MRPMMGGQRGSVFDFFEALLRSKQLQAVLDEEQDRGTRRREHAEDRPSEVRRRAYEDITAALDAIGTVPEGQRDAMMRRAGFTPNELAQFRTPERRGLERSAAGRMADEMIREREEAGKTEESIRLGLREKRYTPKEAEEFRKEFRERLGLRRGAERFAFSRDLPENVLDDLMRKSEAQRGMGMLSRTPGTSGAPSAVVTPPGLALPSVDLSKALSRASQSGEGQESSGGGATNPLLLRLMMEAFKRMRVQPGQPADLGQY